MKIKIVNNSDIPSWIFLSKEYDKYVKEIVPDLTEWYEGNGTTSFSFDEYMRRKIDKNEAFMAINENDNCCGIIAISKTNNNITFFAISHKYDFITTGKLLFDYALSQLDANKNIKINEIKSDSEQMQKQYKLLSEYGFTYSHDDLENGVPVICMTKTP
jgi:hypothetical protein